VNYSIGHKLREVPSIESSESEKLIHQTLATPSSYQKSRI